MLVSLNTIVEASGAPRLNTVASMGFEGVGVFSIKSDLDPLLYIPMFKGGTTTADDDLGFFDDAAD